MLPGTLPVASWPRRLADCRRGRRAEAGPFVSCCAGSTFACRGGWTTPSTWSGPARTGERVLPAAAVDGRSVPYFSLAMVPGGRGARRSRPGRCRGGRAGPGRARLDDAAEPPRTRRGDRPDRLRAVPGAGAAAATGNTGTPATTPTSRPARGWPASWPSRAGRSRWCPRAIPGVFAMATAVLEEAKQWPGVRGPGDPRDDRGPGGRQPGRRAAGPRLRRDLAVRPAQAVGGDRGPADRRRGRADLVLAIYNPASKTPHLAGRGDAGSAAASTATRVRRW